MRIIPRAATPRDIAWVADFHDLVVGLITEGMRPKVAAYLTGETGSTAKRIWREIHGSRCPSGGMQRPEPRFFLNANGSKIAPGAAWNMQSALLLDNLQFFHAAVDVRVNEGWLLLTAYRSYMSQTDDLYEQRRIKRLSIEDGYNLMRLAHIDAPEYAQISLHFCKGCHRSHIAVPNLDPISYHCPYATMLETRAKRSRAGQKGNEARWGGAAAKARAAD